jgi:hypothetical protein
MAHAPDWLAREPIVTPPEAREISGDILFMPGNDWNAATPLQALAFNGGLALRPALMGPDGKPTSNAPAFQAVFGKSVLLGDSPWELILMAAGLNKGLTVTWTRRADSSTSPSFAKLQDVLRSNGAAQQERTMVYHGAPWLTGRARKAAPDLRSE